MTARPMAALAQGRAKMAPAGFGSASENRRWINWSLLAATVTVNPSFGDDRGGGNGRFCGCSFTGGSGAWGWGSGRGPVCLPVAVMRRLQAWVGAGVWGGDFRQADWRVVPGCAGRGGSPSIGSAPMMGRPLILPCTS
ncbi:MAG: hypothetical protein M5U34_45860 [Chloroflexi bacterium]|nr:hypothetical protein [Chloroflexota bacterium]